MAGIKARDCTNQSVGRMNTLGLSVPELAALLKRLDDAEAASAAASKSRRFKRRQLRLSALQMDVHHSGGIASSLSVVCRNISSGGSAVLHNSFMHSGTRVVLNFRHATRGTVGVAGKIAHCAHVQGCIHQLGIKFDHPVKPAEFVQLDQLDDWFTLENVKDEEMRGCIVLAGTSPMEQRLIQSFLKGTDVRLRCAANQTEAMNFAGEGADIVVIDPDQKNIDLKSTIRAFEEGGLAMPIVVVTSRGPDERRKILTELRPAAVLAKPLSRDIFARALAEFLIVGGSAAVAVSSIQPGEEKAALVPEFVRSLNASSADLRDLLERRDLDATQAICAQIASAAGSMGFAGIGAMAEQAERSLTQTRSVESSRAVLQRLISACESAQPARKAG